MSRYCGPRLRIVRRLGDLPGLTTKQTERLSPPGQHGPAKAGKKSSLSEYGIRLQEKQKLRFNYGLSEKQLFNYVKEARRLPGATGSILLQLLEMRLDNIVFRLGMAPTIASARQIIGHKHILVNGNCLSIASYQCQPGDVISVKNSATSKKLIETFLESPALSNIPQHLDFEKKILSAKVLGIVDREWVALKLNELFVIEFYSRKI